MWKYKCPICNEQIIEQYDLKTVETHIGATHDCPNCNGLLMITDDLSCSDFGAELVKRYADMGVTVSNEQATGTFIEF
ncbi:MAG: hypothetical protein FWF80_04030 [Defluviitaleaceae bacterium]|nr:hypothetical protein [Defluviitaleaceae bacterium]